MVGVLGLFVLTMKAIKDYPNYAITRTGKVYNLKFHKFLSARPCGPMGYQAVNLCKDGKHKNRYIHRLLLETFVGPCPNGMECRHLNGNSQDNKLANLCWGTRKENRADTMKHGKWKPLPVTRGEQSPCARLTKRQVIEIRRLYATKKYTQTQLARMFTMAQTSISAIVLRKTWCLC